jgi:hypothetical protein
MPSVVRVTNAGENPINIAGLITLPPASLGGTNFDINLAAISGLWGEFSLRQMVWNGIAGSKQRSLLTIVTSLTPSFNWATIDGFQRGTTGVDTPGARPGMPNFFNDYVRPKISSLAMATATAYVDVTFSEAIYSLIRGPLAVASFIGRFINHAGGITAIAITTATKTTGAALVGGETVVRLNLSVTGTPNNNDEFGVRLAAHAVMDVQANEASTAEVVVACKAP